MNNEAVALWPFSPRNGVGADEQIAQLLAEPEIQLSDWERQQAQVFAKAMFDGNWMDMQGEVHTVGSHGDLESVAKVDSKAARLTFYTGYFATEAGQEELSRFGLQDRPLSELQQNLLQADAIIAQTDAATRRDVANHSRDWLIGHVASLLAEDPAGDKAVTNAEQLTVHFAADKLLDKLEAIQSYRGFYREVRGALKAEPINNLTPVKATLLDAHVAKVNNMLTGLYADAFDLAYQLAHSDDVTDTRFERLISILPFANLKLNRIDDFNRRMDLVRNGAELRGEGNASPISEALLALVDEAGNDDRAQEATVTADFIEKLDTTTYTADELKTLLEAVLQDWDLLSSETADHNQVSDREGRASDNRWQVVITPKNKTLEVNGIKRVMRVPKEFKRKLATPKPGGKAAAAEVSAHELSHVLQNEYDDVLAQTVPLAKVKGRRYVTMREMGGINEERIFKAQLGRSRPVGFGYLRGLQAKLAGGNQLEVARAILQEQTGGQSASEEQRRTAVTSSLRLYRHGGHDSQALDYAEQALIMKPLSRLPLERVRAVAIAGGSFALIDSVELHRVGLYNLPESVTRYPAETVLNLLSAQL